jgi:hypothetical protein
MLLRHSKRVSADLSRPIKIGRYRLDLSRGEPVRYTASWIEDLRSAFYITEIDAHPSDLGSTVAARSAETVRRT